MPVFNNVIINQALDRGGLSGFGNNMPIVSRRWIDASADVANPEELTYEATTLSLTSVNKNWLAPFGGLVDLVETTKPPRVTLMQTDGTAVSGDGLLLEILPPAFLRLRRLFANLLETDDASNPERANGYSLRPVPKYFFFSGPLPSPATGGFVFAGDDLGMSGTLRIFDADGLPIDPLAVTSWLMALLGVHTPLVADADADDQLTSITDLKATDSFTTRMVTPGGTVYAGGHIESETSTDAAILREITRDDATDADGNFPPEEANLLLFAPTTYGRLSARAVIPALPAAITLKHDFISLRVVDLRTYLTGTPRATFNASKIEPKPRVRVNEVINLVSDGNGLLGQLSEVFAERIADPREDALLVGETIETDFVLPTDVGQVHFPAFPALPAGAVVENGDFPPGLKVKITEASTAQFIDDGTVPPSGDVLLTLRGVPVGAAIRAYHRELGIDMTEERGDGAGGVVNETEVLGHTYDGRLLLRLEDPLGLNLDGTYTAPINPILNLDLVIVREDGTRRIFGNVALDIDTVITAAAVDLLLLPFDNGLDTNVRQGVATSGLSGLTSPPIDLNGNLIADSLSLLEEDTPLGRNAPRLPLMLRRDLLAGSRRGTQWRAALGGGRVGARLHSAQSRWGAPGSPGGPETQSTGLYTQHGRLAYDLNRHALRRVERFYDRIRELIGNVWDEPVAPTALPAASGQTADAGPFAAAVLETVAPMVESPELALLKTAVDNDIDSIPEDFNAFIDWLQARVNAINVSSLPGVVDTALSALKTGVIDWLEQQKNTGLREDREERIYNEVLRELSSACYGRRDSLWALEKAIKSARHFIYLETPALAPIRYDGDGAAYSLDLLQLIQDQLDARPGLRVVICTAKEPPYVERYGFLSKKEVHDRFRIFAPTVVDPPPVDPTDPATPPVTSPVLDDARVVIFHPIGFPGRPSALETQTVIIDDDWLLTGSTTFRRRGFTFDGGTDVVLTGYDRLAGGSVAIREHRVALLRQRLNLGLTNKTLITESSAARLRDGKETFYLIREMLRAGGYGVIERLWDGKDPHVGYSTPATAADIANPEGQTYGVLPALLTDWLLGSGTLGNTFHDL